MTYDPHIGDFGVVRTKGFVGKAIRLMTRSQVSHAFIYIGAGWIIEAQARGSTKTKLSKYTGRTIVWNWNSDQYLSPTTRVRIASEARKMLGTPYNFLDLVALFFLTSGFRWDWLLKRAQNNNRMICSQLVDEAYARVGEHLFDDERPSGQVTPGDLLMFIASGENPKIDILPSRS